MADIFTHSHYHFVKIDVDGLDGEIIEWLANRIRKGTLQVDTLSSAPAAILRRSSPIKGVKLFRVSLRQVRRAERLDEKGVDIANGYKPFDLDPILEEHYGQRFLRHVFYVKPTADLTHGHGSIRCASHDQRGQHRMESLYSGRGSMSTKERLLEPEMNAPILDKYVGGGNEGVNTGKNRTR